MEILRLWGGITHPFDGSTKIKPWCGTSVADVVRPRRVLFSRKRLCGPDSLEPFDQYTVCGTTRHFHDRSPSWCSIVFFSRFLTRVSLTMDVWHKDNSGLLPRRMFGFIKAREMFMPMASGLEWTDLAFPGSWPLSCFRLRCQCLFLAYAATSPTSRI